jgi:hypothetical protein
MEVHSLPPYKKMKESTTAKRKKRRKDRTT